MFLARHDHGITLSLTSSVFGCDNLNHSPPAESPHHQAVRKQVGTSKNDVRYYPARPDMLHTVLTVSYTQPVIHPEGHRAR